MARMNDKCQLQHGDPGHAARGLLLNCACGLAHLERIHRHGWMKLLPWLRFYRCSRCGRAQLASKRAVSFAITAHRSAGGEGDQVPAP
jgi:hypothetical protein